MKPDLPNTPLFVDELERVLRAQVERRASQHRLVLRARWISVAVAAVALVLLLAILPTLLSDSGDRVETSTNGDRSARSAPSDPSESDSSTSRFVIVDNDQIYDRANWANLRRELKAAGVTFTVTERPVAPAAAGRIFQVSHSPDDGEAPYSDPDHPGRYYLERGDTLTVVVGVPDDEAASTAGLTLFEVWPELCGAIVWEDPQATATSLQRLGFTVTKWTLITWNGAPGQGPTMAKTVAGPQPGTRILSVLVAPNSSLEVDDLNRKELTIELENTAEPPSHGRPC
jgi:hypothetical protein